MTAHSVTLIPASCVDGNTAKPGSSIGESPLSCCRRGAGGEVSQRQHPQTGTFNRRQSHCEVRPLQSTIKTLLRSGFASSYLLAMTAEAISCHYHNPTMKVFPQYQSPSYQAFAAPADSFGASHLCSCSIPCAPRNDCPPRHAHTCELCRRQHRQTGIFNRRVTPLLLQERGRG
jgi:hypothetical protein